MWYFKPVVDKIRDRHSVGTVDKIAGTEVKNSENRAIFKAFFFLFEKSESAVFDFVAFQLISTYFWSSFHVEN